MILTNRAGYSGLFSNFAMEAVIFFSNAASVATIAAPATGRLKGCANIFDPPNK
jgi:hypothetical protein